MEDSELLARFRDGSIPAQEWTHRCHLEVAIAILREKTPQDALLELRESIQRLNLTHGVWTTPDRGYHETLTRVWLCLVWDALNRLGPSTSNSQVVEASGGTQTPLHHYSRERLFSWQARIDWVEPDLIALPYDPGPWEPKTPRLISFRPNS